MLVKGRRNYVSLRRLDTALSRAGSLFNTEEEMEQLRTLRDWSKDTTDGSLSDLTFKPPGAVWDEVASDNGNCLGKKCPTYQAVFLLPGAAADLQRADPDRESRVVLQRSGAASSRGEHSAQVRRRDL